MPTAASNNGTIAPEFGECQRHGPYAVEYVELVGERRLLLVCPVCERDQHQQAVAWEAERQARDLAARLARATIPARFADAGFENYRAALPGQIDARDAVRAVAEGKTRNMVGLLLLGRLGTGKTHLAVAAVKATIQRGREARYLTLGELLREIRATWGRESAESEERVFRRLTHLTLLVVDEIGVQFGTDFERAIITDVINARYNAEHPTILVSNLPLADFTTVVGERVVDRFREGGRVIAFDWESYRPQKGTPAHG